MTNPFRKQTDKFSIYIIIILPFSFHLQACCLLLFWEVEASTEMTSAISELSPPGRRRASAVDGENLETVCIKRRRRDPAAASYNNQLPGEKQQQQQLLQADQPTATTVKRSSKFRGVSRFCTGFEYNFLHD